MQSGAVYTARIALTVALGGFLMGFDASVISGVVRFIGPQFQLSNLEIGWAVASLTLTSTIAMMLAGPISDRIGRRLVLKIAAVLFLLSALASAFAPDYLTLVAARMLGGFGVGAALIIAPMYIAEVSAPGLRGRMVSLNQLNIVVGISVAYFSNFLILKLGQSDAAWCQTLQFDAWNWRWMLGVEAIPAALYFLALFFVPESPRWLVMKGRDNEAVGTMVRVSGPQEAERQLEDVRNSIRSEKKLGIGRIRELFSPAMKLVMTVAIGVAILQQITGINAVFFYAPMIFEQSGIGTDASFMQAVLVGIVNLVCTVIAILTIDRLGRRPLMAVGLVLIASCMLLLSWGFGSATYTLDAQSLSELPGDIQRVELAPLVGQTFDSDLEFREGFTAVLGEEVFREHGPVFLEHAIDINPAVILFGILGFVAGFALSLGPVMWVLFSELFPNRLRGLAISFVGLINSSISFSVQFLFPWELETIGSSATFLIYGLFAVAGLIFVLRYLPETKGKSLEQLEAELVR